MLAVDTLAAWTGVIGAAVGGGIAYFISRGQNAVTLNEGNADRTHDREMRIWDSRADAYVSVLDYAGRLVGWMENIQQAAEGVTGPTVFMAGLVQWTDDEWWTMTARLRAFGTDSLLAAFTDLHNSSAALNDLIKQSQTHGNVSAASVLAVCGPVHNAAVVLRRRIKADLQLSD